MSYESSDKWSKISTNQEQKPYNTWHCQRNKVLTSFFTPFSAISLFFKRLKEEIKHSEYRKLFYGRFSTNDNRWPERWPGFECSMRVRSKTREVCHVVYPKEKKSNLTEIAWLVVTTVWKFHDYLPLCWKLNSEELNWLSYVWYCFGPTSRREESLAQRTSVCKLCYPFPLC